MRFAVMAAAAAAFALGGLSPGEAAPMPTTPAATLQPAVEIGQPPRLELVRGGCGFGEHRTFRGWCHYNRGWRGRHRYWRNHRWYYR